MRRAAAWIAVMGAVGAGALARQAAQPEQPADPARPQMAGEDREAVKSRLQRRLEDARRRLDESRRAEERITQALERLEAGAPVEEVRGIADGPGRRGRPGGRPGGEPPGGPRPDGPPGGPRGDRAGRPDGPPPPELDRPALLAFLRENAPEMAERLEQVRAKNPEEFERLIDRFGWRVREVMAERDPGLREARLAEFRHAQRMFDASRRFGDLIRRNAPAAEVEAARADLRTLLGEQFDLRLKRHRAEIASLEERVTRIRREAEEYLSRREEIINQGVERAEQRAREGDAPGRPVEPAPPPRGR